MSRRVMASALFAIGVLVASAYGQPPGVPGQPPSGPGQPAVPGQPLPKPSLPKPKNETASPLPFGPGGEAAKKGDQTDALVQAALANDPDVKLAQAKMQLAEAELAKARQTVVLKVMTLNASVQNLKRQVDIFAQKVALDENGRNRGSVALADLLDSRIHLERAKWSLSQAETELKLLTGETHKERVFSDAVSQRAAALHSLTWWSAAKQFEAELEKEKSAAKGPIADRIRAALDKKVKVGNKGDQINVTQALEIFKKEAGLDVPVHPQHPVNVIQAVIKTDGQELTVGAWIQLFEDNNHIVFCVREYGLMVTTKELAPPNALTVLELWKQPLKKDGDEQKKAEPFIRKYIVPSGTTEIVAKMLQSQNARLQVVPIPDESEILVMATEADHAAVTRMLKEIIRDKTDGM